MAVGLDASSSSASSSIKAEKRICKPAVPFKEATFPASVLISYFADAAAPGCTAKAAIRVRTKNVVNKRVFIQYSPQSMKSIGLYRRLDIYDPSLAYDQPPPLTLKQNAEDGIHTSAFQSPAMQSPGLGL